jgi:hypothetical protein
VLFSNAGQFGSVFAALSVGLLAQAFGYPSVFVACASLTGADLVMVCLSPAAPAMMVVDGDFVGRRRFPPPAAFS